MNKTWTLPSTNDELRKTSSTVRVGWKVSAKAAEPP